MTKNPPTFGPEISTSHSKSLKSLAAGRTRDIRNGEGCVLSTAHDVTVQAQHGVARQDTRLSEHQREKGQMEQVPDLFVTVGVPILQVCQNRSRQQGSNRAFQALFEVEREYRVRLVNASVGY